jgi:hypothetical protein
MGAIKRDIVTRFLSSVFLSKNLFWSLIDMPGNDLKENRIFVELFIFIIDSPMYLLPGSRFESIRLGSLFKHKSHVLR